MTDSRTILCPVDFSDASRGAVRAAALVAKHFGADMVVLSVEDPLLTEAVSLNAGAAWDPEETRRELEHFARRALGGAAEQGFRLLFEVQVGRPAEEILNSARGRRWDLIVMSTHGLTGMRKLFFGSTTERVLRETPIPVLVTPPSIHIPETLEELQRTIGRVLAPVDVSPASARQVRTAGAIADALQVPLLLAHVVEPIRSPLAARLHLAGIDHERRTRAEDALAALTSELPQNTPVESLVALGDPAEEIAKLARERQAGLIVIGLHGSPMLGPRMGSVTYRVLALAPALVLALPPAPPAAGEEPESTARSLVHK